MTVTEKPGLPADCGVHVGDDECTVVGRTMPERGLVEVSTVQYFVPQICTCTRPSATHALMSAPYGVVLVNFMSIAPVYSVDSRPSG